MLICNDAKQCSRNDNNYNNSCNNIKENSLEFEYDVCKKRINKLRAKLRDNSIDGVLISKRENCFYLSGFTGTHSYIIITENESLLITDSRYAEQAAREAPNYNVIVFYSNVYEEIKNIIKKYRIKSLGFESTYISYSTYLDYVNNFEVKKLVPLKDFIEEMRIIKDDEEIKLIRNSIKIADEAFDYVLMYIKPGIREIEIAAEIEYFIKKQGGSGPSFQTIVASGIRSSMPHAVASEKKLENGDIVVMDYGAIYHGYCSDITRTIFIGKPDEKAKHIYNTVLEAQLEALKRIRKGMASKDADYIARDVISKAGYGENFGHSLGHGVGLEIHEKPKIYSTDETIIKDGMVVTIEPGVYIKGCVGVRIEDMVLIKDTGTEILTKASKEIIML